MAWPVYILTVNFLLLFDKSMGYARCGDWECFETGAFCCAENPNMCCYHVWNFWWFWMFWLFIIILALSCGFWCRRRRVRSANVDYQIFRRPESSYGATVCTGTRDVSTGYVSPPSSVSVKPPEYTDQRPPAYTTIYTYPTIPTQGSAVVQPTNTTTTIG